MPEHREVSVDLEQLGLEPMQARKRTLLPEGDEWVYEPEWSGNRILAFVTPESVRLRSGTIDRTQRFGEIAEQLQALAGRTGQSFILDGEITRRLRRRAVLYVSDLLAIDDDVLVDLPWTERRARLEELFRRRRVQDVEVVETRRRAGKTLMDIASRERWRGIVAKREDSRYESGRGTGEWVRVSI